MSQVSGQKNLVKIEFYKLRDDGLLEMIPEQRAKVRMAIDRKR